MFLQDINFDPNTVSPTAINFQQPTNYGPGMTALGGGFAAASQMIAGQQSKSLLQANAAIARMQATGEIQAGAEQAEMYRQHLAQRVGQQTAAVGGSGLSMSGSPLRSLETTSLIGAQDLTRIQTNAARKAWGFDTTAAGDELRAGMSSRAGIAGGVGSLITSGARAYADWSFS
ncbi:MAG: hypothetical protein JWO52_7832 [Gammaproteobacteria bacterium]|nr:hypothetical protein [Gammaproteobacteria bacterium]